MPSTVSAPRCVLLNRRRYCSDALNGAGAGIAAPGKPALAAVPADCWSSAAVWRFAEAFSDWAYGPYNQTAVDELCAAEPGTPLPGTDPIVSARPLVYENGDSMPDAFEISLADSNMMRYMTCEGTITGMLRPLPTQCRVWALTPRQRCSEKQARAVLAMERSTEPRPVGTTTFRRCQSHAKLLP